MSNNTTTHDKLASETRKSAGMIRDSDSGFSFETFLGQPEIRQPLMRYVHAETRFVLDTGFNYLYGTPKPVPFQDENDGPGWLDNATENDYEEVEAASYFLDVALQQEFSRRVEAVLAQVDRDSKPDQDAATQKAIQTVTNAVLKGFRGHIQTNRQSLRAGLEAAGILRPSVRPEPVPSNQ